MQGAGRNPVDAWGLILINPTEKQYQVRENETKDLRI